MRRPLSELALVALCGLGAACSVAPASEDGDTEAPTEASSAPAAPASSTTSAAIGATAPETAPAIEGMTLVPAGTFLMGSPEGGSFEERPMHEVIIPATYFDLTEVKHGDYMKCVEEKKCPAPKVNNPFCNAHFDDHDDHPANCIDHPSAGAYCEHLGKRLPTEREWEYAARGGAERRVFSWGNEPANANIACYSHSGTCKVGSFDPGAFGLFDMSGNVWEWTSSWYAPYPDEATTGLFKVYRGGSWSRRFPKWLRNELRNRYRPDQTSAALGVRCVKTLKPLRCPDQTEAREGRCVRTAGQPECESGRKWSGTECVLDMNATGKTQVAAHAPASPGASASTEVAADAPAFVRSRTPQHDSDCQSHWPSTPNAYRWDGGTFHSRNPVIAQAGCAKRDMGRTWTSACCK